MVHDGKEEGSIAEASAARSAIEMGRSEFKAGDEILMELSQIT